MIAAALLILAQAAPVFAPPLDRALTMTTETVRTEGPTSRSFVARRTLRFTAAPDGYRVAVTLEDAGAGEEESDPAGLLRSGFTRLAGRTVVLHLDRTGTVTGVDDAEATWRAVVEGMAALAPDGNDPDTQRRAARVRAIVAALQAQPEAARRKMLASLVAPLIAPELVVEAATPAPPRAVRVPATSVYGRAELDGLRSVRSRPDGVEISVSATGPIAVAGPDGQASATITLETLRRVNPETGLVVESRELVETLGPDGNLRSERLTVTRLAQ
ncbi:MULTISPECIES: hypothetical protein [unclassified Sphingomonas]|uniref:hypothetical protein n=1 Tax=unclassified Sphingomonas TaxID=196159 RepID=UPI002150D4E2|nr:MULTISPECIES: hypothetical protein [unclassified Sphingomonas]MCR5870095.1 hypothetical protein [Sphingomonas sp. J344]UUX98216.1 hypothetical protein LRS08_11455 [Sphingomonas sp. J315]